MLKMARDFAPRVLVGLAVMLVLLYWFLHRTVPSDVLPTLDRGLAVVFLTSAFLCCLPFAFSLMGQWFPTRCRISKKEISQSGFSGVRFLLWKDVKGYAPSASDEFPGLISILVRAKRRKMVLWIPKGELAEQVITTFGERCPLIPEDEKERSEKVTVSDSEAMQLILGSVAYAILAGYLLFVYSSRAMLIMVPAITLFLGPGTIGCLLLYGKKTFREKNVKGIAGVFNMLGFMLLMLTWALFALYHWSQVIKELG